MRKRWKVRARRQARPLVGGDRRIRSEVFRDMWWADFFQDVPSLAIDVARVSPSSGRRRRPRTVAPPPDGARARLDQPRRDGTFPDHLSSHASDHRVIVHEPRRRRGWGHACGLVRGRGQRWSGEWVLESPVRVVVRSADELRTWHLVGWDAHGGYRDRVGRR